MGATPPDPQTPPQPPPTPPTPAPASAPPAAPPAAAVPPTPPEQPLGAPGLSALQAERDARAAAEKRARDAEAERDRLRQASETETQRLQREAEEGRRLAAMGATAIKSANLLTALAGKGLVGPQAMAASRLLDGVEFTESYQPSNLDARIEAAKQMYGEQHFVSAATPPPATPPATPAAPAPGNGGHPPMPTSPFQQQPTTPPPATPTVPDLHNGARPQGPQPTEEEQFEKFFRSTWPGALPEKTTT